MRYFGAPGGAVRSSTRAALATRDVRGGDANSGSGLPVDGDTGLSEMTPPSSRANASSAAAVMLDASIGTWRTGIAGGLGIHGPSPITTSGAAGGSHGTPMLAAATAQSSAHGPCT